MLTGRREFIGAKLGMGFLAAGPVSAQQPQARQGRSSFLGEGERKAPPPVPVRKGRITTLFRSPEGYRNALLVARQGWWSAEKKSNSACLVDSDGRLLKTVNTEATNTSAITLGGAHLWKTANAAP